MAKPAVLATFNETLSYETPTGSGNATGFNAAYDTGFWAGTKGLKTAQSTTNELTNAVFQNDASGWAGVNGTLAHDPATIVSTRKTAKLTATAANAAVETVNIAWAKYKAAAQVQVLSKASSARSFRIELGRRDGVNADLGALLGTTVTVAPNTPTTLSAAWSTGSPANVRVRAVCLDAQAGDVFHVTNAQLEYQDYVSPFAAGDLGNGHAWAGTAYASKSTRPNSYAKIILDQGMSASGGIAFKYRTNLVRTTAAALAPIYSNVAGGGNEYSIFAFIDPATSEAYIYQYNTEYVGPPRIKLTPSQLAGATYFISWDKRTISLAVDDGEPVSANLGVPMSWEANPPLFIGADGHQLNVAFATIGPLIVTNKPISHFERRQILNASEPWTTAWLDTVLSPVTAAGPQAFDLKLARERATFRSAPPLVAAQHSHTARHTATNDGRDTSRIAQVNRYKFWEH